MKKSLRQEVYNKCGGRCAYCGIELSGKWQVDHGVSKYYFILEYGKNPEQVDDIDNLYPACEICNHYKRSLCIEGSHAQRGFRQYMLTFHKRLAKIPKKTTSPSTAKRKEYMQRIADRYGITTDKPFNGVFYFETINQQQLNNR